MNRKDWKGDNCGLFEQSRHAHVGFGENRKRKNPVPG
jgi:hypothetical protein